MPRYKNISSGRLDLEVPGFYASVGPGEEVDIPEFQPDGVSPIEVGLGEGSRWEAVTETPAAIEAAE